MQVDAPSGRAGLGEAHQHVLEPIEATFLMDGLGQLSLSAHLRCRHDLCGNVRHRQGDVQRAGTAQGNRGRGAASPSSSHGTHGTHCTPLLVYICNHRDPSGLVVLRIVDPELSAICSPLIE